MSSGTLKINAVLVPPLEHRPSPPPPALPRRRDGAMHAQQGSRRCRPRKKGHRRRAQQAGRVQSRPDGAGLLSPVDGGREDTREGREPKMSSAVFPSRLV